MQKALDIIGQLAFFALSCTIVTPLIFLAVASLVMIFLAITITGFQGYECAEEINYILLTC